MRRVRSTSQKRQNERESARLNNDELEINVSKRKRIDGHFLGRSFTAKDGKKRGKKKSEKKTGKRGHNHRCSTKKKK